MLSYRREIPDIPVRCSVCDSRRHIAQNCTKISEDNKLYELHRLKTGSNFSKSNPVSVITPMTGCGKCSELDIFKVHLEDDENDFKCFTPQVKKKPVETFEDFFLDMEDKQIYHNITKEKRCNFKVPTPIQQHALPIILEGHDVMGCAQTGTGKTAAYLIPMIRIAIKRGFRKTSVGNDEPQKPEVLIVAPTRELAMQIHQTALKLTLNMSPPCGIKVITGGTKPRNQRDKIRQGCNILIGTPGRILKFIKDYTISMEKTELLVVDEADKMIDVGFRSDLELIIEKTDMPSKKDRQTLMFSATFRYDLQEIAAESMKKEFRLIMAGKINSAQPDVIQVLECVEDKEQKLIRLQQIIVDLHTGSEKRFLEQKCREEKEYRPNINDYLLHVLGKYADLKILIFVETQRDAEDIAYSVAEFLNNFYSSRFKNDFKEFCRGCEDKNVIYEFKAVFIHGGMGQHKRDLALAGFKDCSYPILVATNVAARGLDICNVTHVINYELPLNLSEFKKYRKKDKEDLIEGKITRMPVRDQFEEYIHRIGRTGRAGNMGTSISFFQTDKDSHLAISFVKMLETAKQDVPEWLLHIASVQYGVNRVSENNIRFRT